jgi:hypothetical protein
VISEAWGKENDRIISRSLNHTKANNKKRFRESSKNKSKHFFKNRVHDSYKSTVHIPFI